MSTINLLPEDYLVRRAQRRANFLCLGLFSVVMTGVLTATFVSRRSGRHTEQVRNRVNASYADAAEKIAQMQELESRKQAMCERAEITAALVERVPRSTLLAIITNALPPGASLTKVKLDTRVLRARTGGSQKKSKGAKFDKKTEEVTAPEVFVEMEVTGLAENGKQVGRFMSNLGRNALLTGVDLVFIEEKKRDQVTVREFAVKMQLKPGADAIEAVSPRKADDTPRPDHADRPVTPGSLAQAQAEGASR
jgi:Tfp pilus assembly protein PilN